MSRRFASRCRSTPRPRPRRIRSSPTSWSGRRPWCACRWIDGQRRLAPLRPRGVPGAVPRLLAAHLGTRARRPGPRRRRRAFSSATGDGRFEHRLVEDDDEDVWRVFSTEFKPSREPPRRTAARWRNREVIRLQWAVPVRARQRIGGLWAYFPTLEETTLSGVINAPWKLNDDRTRVIEGPFNREILEHACDSVLQHLEVADDGGRSRRTSSTSCRRAAARTATGRTPSSRIGSTSEAAHHPSIPDQTGQARAPVDADDASEGAADATRCKMWSRVPGRPEDWTHWSIDANQTRRSRAERFLDASSRRATRDGRRVARGADPDAASRTPIRRCRRQGLRCSSPRPRSEDREFAEAVRDARIVVDADGRAREAVRGRAARTSRRSRRPGSASSTRRSPSTRRRGRRSRRSASSRSTPSSSCELLLARLKPDEFDQDWDTIWRLAGARAPRSRSRCSDDAGFHAGAHAGQGRRRASTCGSR